MVSTFFGGGSIGTFVGRFGCPCFPFGVGNFMHCLLRCRSLSTFALVGTIRGYQLHIFDTQAPYICKVRSAQPKLFGFGIVFGLCLCGLWFALPPLFLSVLISPSHRQGVPARGKV